MQRPLLAAAVVGLSWLAACGGNGAQEGQSEAAGGQGAAASLPEGHPPVEGMQVQPVVTRISFVCAGDQTFQVAFYEGQQKAELTLGEETLTLAQRPVESGLEYSDGSVTLHGEGMTAYVEREGEKILGDCKAAGHPTPPGQE